MSELESQPVRAEVASEATLPTRYGEFRIYVFTNDRDDAEHVAMVHGDVFGASEVAARVHVECRTGDVMGSLRCDCGEQLQRTMELLASMPRGVLVYLRRGADTVDVTHARGPDGDARDYAVAAAMLRTLGVRSVQPLTNDTDSTTQLHRYLDGSA